MKKYLVGGAVRDKLLGIEVKDKDYVVTGSTEQEMLYLGFKKVGTKFPVFIHSQTGDEHALARTEKRMEGKSGYHAFEVFFSPDTTLEEDLARRDLTINSLAFNEETKEYIDYYGGLKDLENKVLRHTTNAFKDDPVRVLRLARFLTKYSSLGFTVADETKDLCKQMVDDGLLNNLTAERVWKEIEKTFLEKNPPSIFFNFLQEVGALKVILPELDALKDVPQTAIHHPEICSFKHTMMVVDQAHRLVNNHFRTCYSGGFYNYKNDEIYTKEEKIACLFSALTHDLGKGVTPKEILPKHLGHEEAGVPLIKNVADRLKVPAFVKKLALKVGEDHLRCHRVMEMSPKKLIELYKKWDGKRNPRLTDLITLVCQADSQGRLTFEDRDYPQREFLSKIFEVLNDQNISDLVNKWQHKPKVLQEHVYRRQLGACRILKKELPLELSLSYKLKNIMVFQKEQKIQNESENEKSNSIKTNNLKPKC